MAKDMHLAKKERSKLTNASATQASPLLFRKRIFCVSALSLFGYGHSTPATIGGKTFCMFYALAGIPLGLVMFQSIGERLNTFVAFSMRKIKGILCSSQDEEVSQTHLIIVASNVGVVVITLGAYAFHKQEDWSYFDSLYYCFITLTTIGFGDYVALQKNEALEKKPKYVAFSLIFILFGLTVISAAMNLLVLRFLTMNTEDERRDEVEAKIAAQGIVHLEGDIITANGSLHSGSCPSLPDQIRPVADDDDELSVCSCSCYQFPNRRNATPEDDHHHYTTRRPPGNVTHLIENPILEPEAVERIPLSSTLAQQLYTDQDFELRRRRVSI